jgi:hypothetical protein
MVDTWGTTGIQKVFASRLLYKSVNDAGNYYSH